MIRRHGRKEDGGTTLMIRRRGGALVALTLGLILPAGALAADFVVTNLDGAGAGSLQQAILDANVNGAAETITFAPDLAGGTILLFPTAPSGSRSRTTPPTSPSTATSMATAPRTSCCTPTA
jgi:hypothetical protein